MNKFGFKNNKSKWIGGLALAALFSLSNKNIRDWTSNLDLSNPKDTPAQATKSGNNLKSAAKNIQTSTPHFNFTYSEEFTNVKFTNTEDWLENVRKGQSGDIEFTLTDLNGTHQECTVGFNGYESHKLKQFLKSNGTDGLLSYIAKTFDDFTQYPNTLLQYGKKDGSQNHVSNLFKILAHQAAFEGLSPEEKENLLTKPMEFWDIENIAYASDASNKLIETGLIVRPDIFITQGKIHELSGNTDFTNDMFPNKDHRFQAARHIAKKASPEALANIINQWADDPENQLATQNPMLFIKAIEKYRYDQRFNEEFEEKTLVALDSTFEVFRQLPEVQQLYNRAPTMEDFGNFDDPNIQARNLLHGLLKIIESTEHRGQEGWPSVEEATLKELQHWKKFVENPDLPRPLFY